jgi:DNA invertase Pin-like site-specific DNA recombinase
MNLEAVAIPVRYPGAAASTSTMMLRDRGHSMQIGYARSSTIDQEAGYQAQIKTLKAAGCDKIFAEKVSSVAQRAELEAALEYAREGDALVVTKLDRLARSVAHLVSIGERLDAKASR